MTQHKDTDVQHIKIGDIVDLFYLKKGEFAFALTGSHHHKELNKGIFYLKIRLIERKGYRRVNDEDTYHLSQRDMEDLKRVSGKKAVINTISDNFILRLDYKVCEYQFKKDEIGSSGNIFFTKVAHSFGTHFGAKALEIVNERSLQQKGISFEPEQYDFKPGKFKRKPPATVTEKQKASKTSVLDICLSDAFKLGFFADPIIHEFFEREGVTRLTAAKNIMERDESQLQEIWESATGGEVPFSYVKDEVSEAFIEFMAHMIDERRAELEAAGVKVSYPPLKL